MKATNYDVSLCVRIARFTPLTKGDKELILHDFAIFMREQGKKHDFLANVNEITTKETK